MTYIGPATHLDFSTDEASLQKWGEISSVVATKHGWDNAVWETNFPAKMAFIGTEIDELKDAQSSGNRGEMDLEMADIAIRTLAVLHDIWGAEWSPSRITTRRRVPQPFTTFDTMVAPVERWVHKATQAWRKGLKRDAMICLELLLLELFRLADRLNHGSLMESIALKTRLNMNRPVRHGLVQSVG